MNESPSHIYHAETNDCLIAFIMSGEVETVGKKPARAPGSARRRRKPALIRGARGAPAGGGGRPLALLREAPPRIKKGVRVLT